MISQPLPLPRVQRFSDSGANSSQEARLGRCCSPLPLSSLSRHASNKGKHLYGERDLATTLVSSDSTFSTDDPIDSQLSPQASNYESAAITAINSPTSIKHKDQSSNDKGKDQPKLLSLLLSEPVPPTPPKQRAKA